MVCWTINLHRKQAGTTCLLLTSGTQAQNLASECEIEEEYLVNNLQKRIGKLHLEKSQLEQSLGNLQRKV